MEFDKFENPKELEYSDKNFFTDNEILQTNADKSNMNIQESVFLKNKAENNQLTKDQISLKIESKILEDISVGVVDGPYELHKKIINEKQNRIKQSIRSILESKLKSTETKKFDDANQLNLEATTRKSEQTYQSENQKGNSKQDFETDRKDVVEYNYDFGNLSDSKIEHLKFLS